MDIKEFNNPGSIYRPAPFWSWNDKLDKEELKRQIDEMADKGWGGYFMHSRVGLVTGYLSPEWMEMIKACADEAKATHTYAWLYDEDKWPSGFAGGKVAEMDVSYRGCRLVLIKKDEITDNDKPLEKFKSEGQEYAICKRRYSMGKPWFNGACYVDLMNPEAVKAFIGCTHEEYKKYCSGYFGKEIPGIFTDEPCYLYEHGPEPTLPWSDYLPGYFKKLKGYNIEDHLKELFYDTDDYHKIRFDFFDAATRLFLESWTKQYYNWCCRNNMKMTGHFMAEDSLTYQMQWIGAAMPHYEFMHWPGIDKLGRHIEQLVTVKQVSSVADQLGKERSFSEVFGCIGQQVSFYHRKWIADWQAALGISFVNSHLSLYSMRGERKRDYPADLFYQQPWWKDERKFGDYIGRLCYTVSQGKRDVDILVIHPIGSVWSEYSPLHEKNGLSKEKGFYDLPFESLSKKLIARKLDFHYGDEIIMENHAKVENGKLIIGRHSYTTVIVPPSLTLRANTVRLLKEFAKEAGPQRLIFIKQYPDRIDGETSDIGMPDGIIKASSVDDAIGIVDGYYKDRVRITDTMANSNADKIICHKRISKDGETLFFANTDEKREINAEISLPGTRKPHILDLMSGEVYKTPVTYDEGRTLIRLKFYPAGSLLLLFPAHEIESHEALRFLDSGVMFGSFDKIVNVIDDWAVKPLEENVLPVNDVTLYLKGKCVAKDGPVTKVLHKYFYKAENGTPFKAEYKFEVLDIPEGDVFAAIEVAENLDRITINGTEVKPLKKRGEMGKFDPQKSWKDINFTKVPLNGNIKRGINTLVIEGKKVNNISAPACHVRVKDFNNHMPTEAEAIYIAGDFEVFDLDKVKFAIGNRKGNILGRNLTESGYPFYAGRAEYSSNVNYKGEGRAYLKINDVNAACVELYVNGHFVGVKYWAPYIFDVTKFVRDGNNELKIVAATTLFNLMGPNRIAGIENDTGVGPGTFVDFRRFTEKYKFMPFGISSACIYK